MMKVQKMGGVVLAAAILAAAMAAVAAAAAKGVPLTDTDLESEESLCKLYERWRSVYSKVSSSSPPDLAEEERKFEAFRANARHIHDFNKEDVAYKLGLNKFSDLTLEEFGRMYTGGKQVVVDDAASGGASSESDGRPLVTAGDVTTPDSWDWRDQDGCGSCWAFGAVGAVESINAITTGNLLRLSEQQVLDCSGAGNCSWGYPYLALQYAIRTGITLEDYYPAYDAKKHECRFNPNTMPVVKIEGECLARNTGEDYLKWAVRNQPVVVIIDALSYQFQSYKGGVFTGPCSATETNHVVLVVGYGTTREGMKYWIVKNSWGNGWGEEGYIRMQRDIGTQGGVSAGSPPIPPTPPRAASRMRPTS